MKCRSLKSQYHRLLLYRAFHYHCKIILHSCKALQCFANVIPLLKRIVNFYQPPCGLNSQHWWIKLTLYRHLESAWDEVTWSKPRNPPFGTPLESSCVWCRSGLMRRSHFQMFWTPSLLTRTAKNPDLSWWGGFHSYLFIYFTMLL